jgi:hypothetical protein
MQDQDKTAADKAADGKAASPVSFGQTMKEVAFSFVGIRKYREEGQKVKFNPVHVVIAGILGVALFIFVLLMIVKSVVAK